ncbi:hypothetical protein DAMA08_026080 [Martiniozyma asiatica (nom. inval.)]|nr:hypothetical protein DAMA08_026080 [Martiniozyma asiatica]
MYYDAHFECTICNEKLKNTQKLIQEVEERKRERRKEKFLKNFTACFQRELHFSGLIRVQLLNFLKFINE